MSDKEWFNISEIANILGCSRPTVYKKINTIDKSILHTLQKRKKNITYYTYTLIDMFKDKINNSPEDIDQKELATDIVNDKYIDIYVSELKSEIDFLKDHVQELSERLKQEQDLNKNNQVLQLRQPQDIKQLEEHFQDLDTKLIDIRDQMGDHKEPKDQKPISFFSKLFK